MTCKPSDLVFIPFPYSDLTATKKRPVLVLISPDRHGDFIALAVTSVQTDEHAVQIDAGSLTTGTLPKISWIRLDKIFTLSGSNILKVFGTLFRRKEQY
jgi:PemK-like protein.